MLVKGYQLPVTEAGVAHEEVEEAPLWAVQKLG